MKCFYFEYISQQICIHNKEVVYCIILQKEHSVRQDIMEARDSDYMIAYHGERFRRFLKLKIEQ